VIATRPSTGIAALFRSARVASLVANAIFENIIKRCDALIDLHTGSNFRTNVAQIRVDVEEPESLDLAESFGVGVIVGVKVGVTDAVFVTVYVGVTVGVRVAVPVTV